MTPVTLKTSMCVTTSPAEENLRTKPCTVLVSLTEQEFAWFFPKNDLDHRVTDEIHLVRSEADTPETWREEIEHYVPEIIVGAWKTPLLPIPESGLPCRYYCHLAGAVRRTVPRELLVRGLVISNWGTCLSRYVAEAALALLLAALRNQTAHQFDMHLTRDWRSNLDNLFNRSLFNLRIGLHGYGAIAREFVLLVAPFIPRLQAYDPFADRVEAIAQGVQFVETLDELFSGNEAIVDFCALTEDTRGIVTERLLRLLPRGAAFINVARGAIVDESALARLVAEGRLKVGLDVFAKEPLPEDSPLRGMDHATLTPHTSGKVLGAHEIAGHFGLQNLRRYLNAEPLEGAISLAQYDRMT